MERMPPRCVESRLCEILMAIGQGEFVTAKSAQKIRGGRKEHLRDFGLEWLLFAFRAVQCFPGSLDIHDEAFHG
jgi:hypothetical protein